MVAWRGRSAESRKRNGLDERGEQRPALYLRKSEARA